MELSAYTIKSLLSPTEVAGAEPKLNRIAVAALIIPAAVLLVLFYSRYMVPPSNFEVVSATQSWGVVQFNESVDGNSLAIAGASFKTGLGTHANSFITLTPKGKFSRLTGYCGIDGEAEQSGSVVFRVNVEGKNLFSSPLMRGGDAALSFDVPVAGVSKVDLIVENGQDGDIADHADWVNLRFY